MPFKCRVEVMLRHVQSSVDDGNLDGAISILDAKTDHVYGIKQLSGTPNMLKSYRPRSPCSYYA